MNSECVAYQEFLSVPSSLSSNDLYAASGSLSYICHDDPFTENVYLAEENKRDKEGNERME